MTNSCSTVRPLLFAALEGQVSPEERVAIHAHLAHCDACRSLERAERALTDVLAPRSEIGPARPRPVARRLAATFGVAAAATLLFFVLPAAAPEGSIVERRLGPGMEWEVAGESDVSASNDFRVPGTGSVDIRLGKGVHLTANGPTGFGLDFVDKRWEVVVSEGVVRADVARGGNLVARYRTGSAALGRGSYELTPNGVREPEDAEVEPEKDAAACIAEGQKLFSEASRIQVVLFGNGDEKRTSLAAAEKLFVQALRDRRITSGQRATALFYLGAAQGRQDRPADALATAQSWLAEFPSHPDRPHVLFYAAAYHENLGEIEVARRTWKQVMKEFPRSPWARHSEAYLNTIHNRVKDRKSKQGVQAEESKPVKDTTPAWVSPSAGQTPGAALLDQGLRRFRMVTAGGLSQPSSGTPSLQNMAAAELLLNQALLDRELAPAQRRQALFYLSAAQSWQNSPADALRTSEMWLRENPEHADRPQVLFYAAWYLERLGRIEEAQRMRGQIRSEFSSSPWADHAKAYMETIQNRIDAKRKRAKASKQGSVHAPKRPGVALPVPRVVGGGYLVVEVGLGGETRSDAGFAMAARSATAFHDAKRVAWDGRDADALRTLLARHRPANVLLVLRPDLLDINLHRRVLLTTMGVDEDPFVDCSFGYLTARDGAAVKALWRRIEGLHRQGLGSKTWIRGSVTSSPRSLDYANSVPAVASAAGFAGGHFYVSIHDEDKLGFAARKLAELKEAAVIQFTGNGDPQGIWLFDGQRNMDRSKHWAYDPAKVGQDPDSEMTRLTAASFRGLGLSSPIIWSGTCHSAAVGNVFVEGDIVSTFGRTDGATLHRLDPEESLGLALIDAGAAALLAPVAANHGMSVSMETDFALRTGASLGEILKSTYDDVALAADGELVLDFAVPGEMVQGREYVMQGGGANRILIGDPALRPFEAVSHPQEAVAVERDGDVDRFRVVVSRQQGFLPRAWDIYGRTQPDDWRVITRVDLTELLGDRAAVWAFQAAVSAIGPDGTALPYRLHRCRVEEHLGRRYLHLQANGRRSVVERKSVELTFDVRAVAPR